MLHMRAHAQLRRFKAGTLHTATSGAQATEIVLVMVHVTAIGVGTRFDQGLGQCQIGANAFALGLLPI